MRTYITFLSIRKEGPLREALPTSLLTSAIGDGSEDAPTDTALGSKIELEFDSRWPKPR
jgi:hypothetical protein